jgi:hypothetical protein
LLSGTDESHPTRNSPRTQYARLSRTETDTTCVVTQGVVPEHPAGCRCTQITRPYPRRRRPRPVHDRAHSRSSRAVSVYCRKSDVNTSTHLMWIPTTVFAPRTASEASGIGLRQRGVQPVGIWCREPIHRADSPHAGLLMYDMRECEEQRGAMMLYRHTESRRSDGDLRAPPDGCRRIVHASADSARVVGDRSSMGAGEDTRTRPAGDPTPSEGYKTMITGSRVRSRR